MKMIINKGEAVVYLTKRERDAMRLKRHDVGYITFIGGISDILRELKLPQIPKKKEVYKLTFESA